MSFYDQFILMSVDARNSFAERHEKEFRMSLRYGTPPPVLDDEVITVTKEQMLAFGVKYQTTNREELEAALAAHSEEAGFSAIQVSYLFKSANGFYSQVKDELGILVKGERLTDEEFFDRLYKLHFRGFAEYKKFLYTPEGKGWPLETTLYKRYGNLRMLFAALYCRDMNMQFKLYVDSSILHGKPLNEKECVQLGIQYQDLCQIIGEENLTKFAQNKIDEYTEGETGFETLESILEKKHHMKDKERERKKDEKKRKRRQK